jgi:hypothetical protein
MPRAAILRSTLAALALALLLAGSAAAASGAPRALHTTPAAPGLAAPLSAAWQWWSGLWSSTLTHARGQQGSGVDPNGSAGRPALGGALPGYSAVAADNGSSFPEGSGVDPNGSH